MAEFSRSDDLRGARFEAVDLRGARFVGADVSDIVMRGVEAQRMEIDSPWIFDGDNVLRVNGIDVLPYVQAELDRRFPGRALGRADDPDGLRAGWSALETAWSGVLERVSGMPPGTAEERVEGEWSFAQTLRHLVLATDMWLGLAILEREQPFHPLGLMDDSSGDGRFDMSVFSDRDPSYDEVLEARADRFAMVRDFLADLTPQKLAEPRRNPHAPQHGETVLSCLHTILEEEWEHHRYAVRDLDVLASGSSR